MAILYAAIVVALVIYLAVSIALYLDYRGERAARDGWQTIISPVPLGAARLDRKRLDALGTAVTRIGVRIAVLEAIVVPLPPVDRQGNLDGVPPPASETPEQIRARLEAKEDERERARARGEVPPSGGRVETQAEESARFRLHCNQGMCSNWDCACACEGCVTARGEKRDTLTPTQPSAPTLDARIEHLWHEKIAAAQEAGKDARHCHGALCMTGEHAVEACGCGCDGCELVLDLLIAAQREIKGWE